MALPAIEEQVIDLRETLNEFIRFSQHQSLELRQAQVQTERSLEEMSREMKQSQLRIEQNLSRLSAEMLEFKDEMKNFKDEMLEFKNEMREFKNEMKDFKDEMLEFKDEMKDFKDEMKGFKDEMHVFKDEMKGFKDDIKGFEQKTQLFIDETLEDRKRMNKQWGDLANRLGTIVEDIVAPNIEGIAQRYFGCTELDSLVVRHRKRHPQNRTQRREFDVIALWENNVLLNETKSTARMDYVQAFIEFLRSEAFFGYFPEYRGKTLIPVFSSLYLPDDVVDVLTQAGVYAMAMSDDSMDLLNFDRIKL
ncbi:MAG: hypothetical protein AB1547_02955 [Thermodesulfobacteriota bacterium]